MTCSGDCCSNFCLSTDLVVGLRQNPEEWEDGPYIADMIIPLEDPLHFTCRHHDKKTKWCMAYESRPKMCRRFPEKQGDCSTCYG